MKWITATEINNWTVLEPRRAQEIIPLLVWKLILASCKSINDHHFPYGKAIQYSGYDGVLDTDDESPFYPTGKSVWEIGTSEDSQNKFNTDYAKRTDNPNNINMRETTFCFVTSRIWNHHRGIAEATEEKASERKWKGIRIIDANSLEIWLNACPAVNAWFSNVIGKPSTDIQELGEYWQSVVNNTSPQLTEEFFKYNRQSVVERVVSQINAGATNIVLVGSSSLEARLIFAAELSSSDDLTLKELAERCLIVNSQVALNEIDKQINGTFIIPTFHPCASQIRTSKNIWLIPVCRFDPLDLISKTGNRVEIPPRSRHEFCEALEKLGYDTNTAFDIGHDLRCSFPALIRKISTNPLEKIPEWSRGGDEANLVPALFAGSWEENSPGDKSIISALAGMPYQEYMASIQGYITGENAPIFAIDQSYACIAISDMWDILWGKITRDIFVRFKECFCTVFSENDPTYELPEKQWYMASVLGKSPSYSNQLKESLIVSAIMLTEREETEMGSVFSSYIMEECFGLVCQVFGLSNSLDHWRTLCPHIPTFIEVAPDAVLRTLEEAANQPESPLWELFKSKGDVLFGRSFYTHILWALEKVMWDKQYASRALRLLICFSEKNFEYKMSNGPNDTLYRIFCLWQPQGAFTLNERKILLADIMRNHHSIAPKLVASLLSNSGQVTYDIAKPKWRSFEDSQKAITVAEHSDLWQFTAQTYLEHILPCYEDWTVVFSNLSSFGSLKPIIDKCVDQSLEMNESDKLKLCGEISKYISRCRKFGHDEPEQVDAMEKLYFDILPDSPKSYAHYFSYHFYGLNPLPYTKEDYNFGAERQQLIAFQREKVQEMIMHYGLDSVLEIMPQIENISAYATVIAESVMNGVFDWEYIDKLKKINAYIASGAVSNLYQKSGLSMLETGENKPEDADLGWVLSCMPISKEITDYVEGTNSEACRQSYWEKVCIFAIDTEDEGWIKQNIQALLKYKRPNALIDCLSYSDWNDSELILNILHEALRQYPEPDVTGLTLAQVGNDDIERMFLKLYSKTDISELDVAKLELAYLQIFNMNFEPKYLVNQVLSCPELYLELLTVAYRSDDNVESSTQNQVEFAKQAYDALNRIRRIPGVNKDTGQLDELIFFTWVTDVTELSKSRHYSLANDIVMGNILSYAPIGKDGFWPAECVRRIFENPHSDTLENHFIIGKENQRGVHTATGGRSEDVLAEQYSVSANKLQLLYPHTAAILRRISDHYRSEAKRERARELKGYQ